MEFRLNAPVNPGQCVTIDYDIGFHTDFGRNQTWDNSVTVNEYWSLPSQSGQRYAPDLSAAFTMTNTATIEPPVKTVVAPASGEATIGQEVTYEIRVPGTAANAALHDVVVSDTLHASLEFMGAGLTLNGTTTALTNIGTEPTVRLAIGQIPAGQQAVIELRARVRNIAEAQEGVSVGNSASFTYADAPGGPAQPAVSSAPVSVKIVEPRVTAAKNVSPTTPASAGDVLTYTLQFDASGGVAGDNFSDAFDLTIVDSLSLGLAYVPNSATVDGAGNSIGEPVVVTGDGVTTPYTLRWSLANGNADIDIAEGAQVTVSYQVRVLDSVLPNQTLSNSVRAEWTGLDGPSDHERTGTGTPAHNDYFTTATAPELVTADNNSIAKTRLTDTYGPLDANVRIGDIVEYELRLGLQEGSHANVVVTDTLPRGLVFEGVVGINGDTSAPYAAAAPFSHADIPAASIVASGDPAAGPTTVTWSLGDIVNTADGNATNDEFVIVYRARVLNAVHPHVNTISLTNTVRMDYDTATGPAPARRPTKPLRSCSPTCRWPNRPRPLAATPWSRRAR